MVFKLILSGRNSHQLIMDNGFRYTMNRKPHGPNLIAYYNCVVRSCPVRAETGGSLDDENIQLKKIFKAKFNMKYKKYLCPFHVKYIFLYMKF